MDPETEQTAKPRRRWLRFSLRTLLIVVTVLSVPLGWVAWKRGQERATITWVEKMGGEASFQSQYGKSWWEKTTNKWFGERVASVSLPNTQVIELSPLAELKNLEVLKLYNSQVNDLSPLAELKNLGILWLSDTQVNDLSPLAELESLYWLELSNTQVSDLSPLVELKNLEVLYLSNTQVSDEQVQELGKALPNCRIKD